MLSTRGFIASNPRARLLNPATALLHAVLLLVLVFTGACRVGTPEPEVSGPTATSRAASPEPEPNLDDIALRLEDGAQGWRLAAENLRPVAVEVLVRRRADLSLVESFVLPGESSQIILEWPGLDRDEVVSVLEEDLQVGSIMGDPASIDPDEEHLYRLPFRAGRRYRLVQGFHGKKSHRSEVSRYALDFEMPVGEPIHAARAGKVVKVVDWLTESGSDSRLLGRDNRIIVEHSDGTLATYAHLAPGGVVVEEGERVERGQHLGFSGRTGFTSGPHLHFVVRGARDVSIPIRFEGQEGRDLSEVGGTFGVKTRD